MWFDDSLTTAWEEGITPVIEDAGYEALRIDRKEHVNKIDNEIIAEIRRPRFIVADFTHGDEEYCWNLAGKQKPSQRAQLWARSPRLTSLDELRQGDSV